MLLVSVALLAGAQLFVGGCNTESPTRVDLSSLPPYPTTVALGDSEDGELFSCLNIAERARVRFIHGPPSDNMVVLFYNYEGAPPGDKFLYITWDEVGDPTKVQRISLGDGEPQRSDDTLFDLEGTIEHIYDLRREEEKQVRVSLVREGFNGGCDRVRRVTVRPPDQDGNNSGGVFPTGSFPTPTGSFPTPTP